MGNRRYSIITDHLGTPYEAYDKKGEKIWACELDVYGKVRTFESEKNFIPFRYQGQYEDEEAGLYYNRFRYYSLDSGTFISQDLIGLASGEPNFYAYVEDTNTWVDVFGLAKTYGRGGKQKRLRDALDDKKLPKYIRGWIRQELNQIRRGRKKPMELRRKNIRNPKGYDLAHKRGYEADKGYGYENSNFQNPDLHKLQHKHDNKGKLNKDAGLNI